MAIEREADRLAVQGLRAGYGQSEVLHSLDFTVGAAEIVVIVGRNGMGKSTLMKSLIGMIPSKGGHHPARWRGPWPSAEP